MKKILFVVVTIVTLVSCKKEQLETNEVCPGGCNSEFQIISPSATLQSDGYWHVPYLGANYFTVEGNLSQLNSSYVVNGVPLIETDFDSDYWVLFDSIQYQTPMYSYLGWYSNNQFTIQKSNMLKVFAYLNYLI